MASPDPASRAVMTECSKYRHSMESSRPRLTWVLSPLMSEPLALRKRWTVSAMIGFLGKDGERRGEQADGVRQVTGAAGESLSQDIAELDAAPAVLATPARVEQADRAR